MQDERKRMSIAFGGGGRNGKEEQTKGRKNAPHGSPLSEESNLLL
jgi:hypothetical protein